MCFVYNATGKMGDYDKRKFTQNTALIRKSDDPYDVLRVVFLSLITH